MARAHHQLPFGGGNLSHDEFFRQRIGYDPAHEDPNYQAELGYIAANLESLFSEKLTTRTDNGRLRIEHRQQMGNWAIVNSADSFKSVREGRKQHVYRVGTTYTIFKDTVYQRYFEITRDADGQFNFREASVGPPYADASRRLLSLVTLSSPMAPTEFDLHELQVAVILLEAHKPSD